MGFIPPPRTSPCNKNMDMLQQMQIDWLPCHLPPRVAMVQPLALILQQTPMRVGQTPMPVELRHEVAVLAMLLAMSPTILTEE